MLSSRIPVAGAFTDLFLGPLRVAAFGGQFQTSLGSSAGVDMITRLGSELVNTTGKAIRGEELDYKDFDSSLRLAPGLGSPVGVFTFNQFLTE